ncbi:MAG TPA: hypothetical protein VMV56_07660 [Williamwhitmania sp.]|nr:hypothetical protein [Williamwhitmania sp.]
MSDKASNNKSLLHFIKTKFDTFRDRTFLTGKRLSELVEIKLREAIVGTDIDEDQFRPISGDYKRDLTPINHERHQDICYKLWLQNPLAKQIIRNIKNFVIGGGLKIKADEDLKTKVIDPFWNDPKNNMDIKLNQKVEALCVFGEQFYPVFVNEINGKVRLGYLDPKSVQKVITNPENIEEPLAIKVRGRHGIKSKTLKIIAVDEDPTSPTYGKLTGDVFYFAINKMPNSTRGYSDLLANSDWLDGYEQFLFNVIDRSVFLNIFIWDVLLKGKTDEEVKKYSREHGKPKPGTVRYHNENVEWNAVAPDLKSSDMSELFKIFRTHIIGSMGFPLHWFGDGSDANLATSKEMGWPTYKMLEERQNYIKFMLKTIIQFVIDQALIYKTSLKKLDGKEAIKDYEVTYEFPELTTKDVAQTASAFQTIAQGLAIFKTHGWLSDETAVEFLSYLAGNIGIEIDATEEWEKAQGSNEDSNNKDYKESDLEKIKNMILNSDNGLDKQIAALMNAGTKSKQPNINKGATLPVGKE